MNFLHHNAIGSRHILRTLRLFACVAAITIFTRQPAPTWAQPQSQPQQAQTQPQDNPNQQLHRRTQAFLSRAVTAQGLVDYEWAKSQITQLSQIVDSYAHPRKFRTKNEHLAFGINAYNMIVIQQVLINNADTLKSVIDIDGFFDKTVYRIEGRTLTLNQIENRLLRPLGDPRIHAALVCAAISCPPLSQTAYTAEQLDDQLNHASRRWINDPTKNTATNDTLRLSQIFKWYAQDFDVPPYHGIRGFLRAHANPTTPIAKLLTPPHPTTTSDATPPIESLDYDWTLNAALPQ